MNVEHLNIKHIKRIMIHKMHPNFSST